VPDACQGFALVQQAAEFIGHGIGDIDETEIGARGYVCELAQRVIDDGADVLMLAADTHKLLHAYSLWRCLLSAPMWILEEFIKSETRCINGTPVPVTTADVFTA
jgi:hypothetical protein